MSTGRTRHIYSSMQLTCSLLVLGIFGIHIICCHAQIDPLALGRADPQCWESSTAMLLEMKKPRIADSVSGFWDFMIFLKSSDNYKHGVLFWDLAQLFWDIYVDCVLSRTHGLGRRQLKDGEKRITNFISQLTPKILTQKQRPLQAAQKEFIEKLTGLQLNKSRSKLLASNKRGMKRI